MPSRPLIRQVLCASLAAAWLASCGQQRSSAPIDTQQRPPDVASAAPEPESTNAPAGHPALIHTLTDSLLSGPVPHDDADFDDLAARGIKTIISVDGATPDLARARARGMRYVHLPTTYSGIPRARQAELARAVRDLPGPVYVHCHHGKHRGPAAAASAAIMLDLITPEEGLAFLRDAGTSPSYPGLWSCVRFAGAASSSAIDAASAEFPEVAPVPGFVEAMVQMELAMSHLDQIRAAGWETPRDHPDLVPAAEAGRLADLLRDVRHDTYVKQKDSSEFLYFLLVNADRAKDLEDAIVAGRKSRDLDTTLELVAASCKDCHVRFRNE